MSYIWWVYKTDGEVEEVNIKPTLTTMQEKVGGYIEFFWQEERGGDLINFYGNESGRLLKLPTNKRYPSHVGDIIAVRDKDE